MLPNRLGRQTMDALLVTMPMQHEFGAVGRDNGLEIGCVKKSAQRPCAAPMRRMMQHNHPRQPFGALGWSSRASSAS